jgi:hypothetical protein
MKLSALAVATALFSGAVFAAPLTLQTYNPQEKGILPLTRPSFPARMKRCCLTRNSASKMAKAG